MAVAYLKEQGSPLNAQLKLCRPLATLLLVVILAIAEEAPVIAEDAGYYSKPGGVVIVDETNVPTAVSDTTPSELAEVAASEFTFQAQKESLP